VELVRPGGQQLPVLIPILTHLGCCEHEAPVGAGVGAGPQQAKGATPGRGGQQSPVGGGVSSSHRGLAEHATATGGGVGAGVGVGVGDGVGDGGGPGPAGF